MGFRRKLAFSALVACFACLPGILQAQSVYTHTISISDLGTPAKFELYVTYFPKDTGLSDAAALEVTVPAGGLYTAPAISFGDWEVTVAFDLAHCGIYCAYRRKQDVSGRTGLVDPLPPPVAAIRVYTGSAAKPAIVFVDPAGLSLPAASGNIVLTWEVLCIPARKLFPVALAPQNGDKSSTPPLAHLLPLTHNPEATVPAVRSLRI